MALKTLVKLSEVTNLSDARYGAGMGVQMMGFNINPESEHYIDPDKFKEITHWIAGVELVGEFDGDILSFNVGYSLDYIQVSDPEMIKDVIALQKKVIFRVDLDKVSANDVDLLMSEWKSKISFYLLEKSDNIIDPTKLKVWSSSFPVILGFGISDEIVDELLEKFPIKGIAIKGGEEQVVGFKDYDQLSSILMKIETEDS